MALNKPPINTTADTIAVKGWFTDVYKHLNSGLLVPGGGSFSTPFFPSRRNLLVNGDFMINQRVPTVGTAMPSTAAGTQWTLDRWAITAPANQQVITQALMSSSQFPISIGREFVQLSSTAGNTGTGTMYFAQAIESAKVQEIAGLPVTLSFWATCGSTFGTTYWANQTFNGATGIIMANVQSGTGVNEGTFAAYTGSVFLPTCGFTPTKYWQFYSVTATVPVNSRELKVYFQVGKTTHAYDINAWIGIANVQLEVGTQPTAFDKISFDQSLLECQRFYETNTRYEAAPANGLSWSEGPTQTQAKSVTLDGTNSTYLSVPFKVKKAPGTLVPTFFTPVSAVAGLWYDNTISVVGSAVSSVSINQTGMTILYTRPAPGNNAGDQVGTFWTVSADI